MRLRSAALVVCVLAAACARGSQSSPPPAPAAAPEGPGVDQYTFVSTSNNGAAAQKTDEDAAGEIVGDFAVKSPEAAKALAEEAVAGRLDPKKTWRLSPVLPTSWPAREQAVAVYFYPMAANPHSLTYFQLFSAAYRVDVSLVDGTTKVLPIPKQRQIGTVRETRPSSLERRELDLAEASLVRQLLGADIEDGENTFWGYLKFIHEHPEIGRDVERRASAFVKWVRHKGT